MAHSNAVMGNWGSAEHPLKNMVDRGIFDQLEDFEEFNGGSVTFGGSKGYISGKGRIRVGNLDFDSVSFVKELGHFNLFSISQICDKQHKPKALLIQFYHPLSSCVSLESISPSKILWEWGEGMGTPKFVTGFGWVAGKMAFG
ncbi:hypothetical protein Tco_0329269 [Tanacetum coccineum]